MSAAQQNVLRALQRAAKPTTATALAQVLDARLMHVQHTLDALYRRSLVTLDERGRWTITERGQKAA